MRVASANAGVNSNLLADELAMDPLSGNAVLNGIPVSVCRAETSSRLEGEGERVASGPSGDRHAAAGEAGAAK